MDCGAYSSKGPFTFNMVGHYSNGLQGGNLFQVKFILVLFLAQPYWACYVIDTKCKKVPPSISSNKIENTTTGLKCVPLEF